MTTGIDIAEPANRPIWGNKASWYRLFGKAGRLLRLRDRRHLREMLRAERRAEAADDLVRAMIEAVPNAMLMVGADGIISLANGHAAQLFGYAPGELTGRPVEDLVPGQHRRRHEGHRRHFLKDAVTRAMNPGRTLHGLRKDGTEIPLEIGLNALPFESRTRVLVSIHDARSRHRAEQNAASAAALSRAIINSAPFAIIATDPDGLIVDLNRAAEEMLGYGRDELIGRSPLIFHESSEIANRKAELEQELGEPLRTEFDVIMDRLQRGEGEDREWTYVRKDGSRLPVHLTVTALRDETGAITGSFGIAHDITERKRADDHIRHIAHHDVLTGLPNRILMKDRLEMAVARADRFASRLGLVLIDLDQFKQVNDTLGHHVGDELLIHVAGVLRQALRTTDTVVRMGGDEFVLILPDVHDAGEVVEAAQRVVQRIARPATIAGHALQVTASAGIALYPDHGDEIEALLTKADMAMYAAKRSGRGRLQCFDPAMARKVAEKHDIEQALAGAIERGEFSLAYQPQVSLTTGDVVAIETLLRWHHPEHGAVSPADFIPLAEETGLIAPICDWVLRTACAEVAPLLKARPPLRLAFNVSPRHLLHERFAETLTGIVAARGIDPRRIELEITENALMTNTEHSLAVLQQLRARGFSVAIDDFGTGFSSLAYLIRFPVDRLKIDRAFIHDLTLDDNRAAVAGAMIAMGRRLGIRVVAEGVERAEQASWLVAQNCDEAQGYHFARPAPVAELAATISRAAAIAVERSGRSTVDWPAYSIRG